MFNIGVPELILILVICLLLFGAARLPQIARSLGKSMGEFKKGLKEGQEEQDKSAEKSDK